MTRRRAERKGTQHQIAIMSVEKTVEKLDQPKMAPDSFRLAAALEKLGDGHFRIVDGDDRNTAVTERGNGVFGIDHRDTRIYFIG